MCSHLAMDEITNLLAKATIEEPTPVSDDDSFADTTSKPVLRLRKAFDHFLFFRTICDTTSGHTPGSEHIVAGLSSVGEVDIPQLKSWLDTHGNNVRQTTTAGSHADQNRKVEIVLHSSPLPPISYVLATELLISNAVAIKILKSYWLMAGI